MKTSQKVSGVPVPEWKLERLLLGELSEPEATALRAKLEAEPGGLARLEALERSNAEILAAHPPAEMAREIERRHHLDTVRRGLEQPEAPGRFFRPLLFALPTAAAATLAIVLLQGPPPLTVLPLPPEHTTIKGLEADLHIHRQTPDGEEELQPGALTRAGDLLQLRYNAAGKTQGLILSLDGRGAVTVHLAGLEGLASTSVERSGDIKLGSAYELDDAPEFERFFFLLSDTPFESAPIIAAVKLAGEGALDLGDAPELPSLEIISFTLRKESP